MTLLSADSSILSLTYHIEVLNYLTFFITSVLYIKQAKLSLRTFCYYIAYVIDMRYNNK